MQKVLILMASVLGLLHTNSTSANDSVVSIDSGNVVFEKTENISMESEVLEISQEKVTVEYLFKNLKDKPLETMVSFPLADLYSEAPLKIRSRDWLEGKDPLGFRLKVDGKEKPIKILAKQEFQDPAHEYYNLKVNYTWKQQFPVGKLVRISHQYKAVLGSGGATTFSDEDKKTYCIDENFLKAFEALKARLRKKLPNPGSLDEYMHFNSFGHFAYILKTANNWAGSDWKFSPEDQEALAFDAGVALLGWD